MIKDSFILEPRWSDLDTQGHVTSRTYEQFCWEGRHRLLEKQGYPLEKLMSEKILLRPVKCYVRFYREQQPGSRLEIITRLYTVNKNLFYWVQEIFNVVAGDLACRIITVTRQKFEFENIELLSNIVNSENEISINEVSIQDVLKKPRKFSGKCLYVISPFVMQFSERTYFFDYPLSAIWRIFEEGRWAFGQKVGFNLKNIEATDTTTFFIGATFFINQIPFPGEELKVHTWVEKIDKIRLYMRQDVTRKNDNKVLLSVREEQIIVSFKKRRPKKAPEQWSVIVGEYMEAN